MPLIPADTFFSCHGRARHARILAALCALPLLSATQAAAGLKLCNLTESRVGITVGYKDTKGWVTEGWWNVPARGCVTLINSDLEGKFYYVHAIDYDRGGEWSGKTSMCVDDKSFTIRDVRNCVSRGHKEMGFYEVDTGDAKDYTIRLIDPVKSSAGNQ